MALKLVIFIAFSFVVNLSATPVTKKVASFRNDYTYIDSINLFLKYHIVEKTWSDAVTRCSAEGAELFVPKTEVEAQAALLFKKNFTGTVWLGIHDMFSEGDFITIKSMDVSEVYKNWMKGEPNNGGNDENCVSMDANGQFNDEKCDRLFKYICAREPYDLQRNEACETYDNEYIFIADTGHCYKLHREYKKWTDAFKQCRAEMSMMTVINSENEAKMLVNMLEKYPVESLSGSFEKSSVYLGFSSILNKEQFLTIDGNTLTNSGYDTWAAGQPDGDQTHEKCGSMLRNGELGVLDCNKKAMFTCEKVIGASTIRNNNYILGINITSA